MTEDHPSDDVRYLGAVTISRNGYVEGLERMLADERAVTHSLHQAIAWGKAELAETVRQRDLMEREIQKCIGSFKATGRHDVAKEVQSNLNAIKASADAST